MISGLKNKRQKTSWRKRSRGWAQHKSRRPRARCAKTHTRAPAFTVFHVRARGNLAGSVSKGYCGRRFYLFAIKALIKSLWNILAVWNPYAPLICERLATRTGQIRQSILLHSGRRRHESNSTESTFELCVLFTVSLPYRKISLWNSNQV